MMTARFTRTIEGDKVHAPVASVPAVRFSALLQVSLP